MIVFVDRSVFATHDREADDPGLHSSRMSALDTTLTRDRAFYSPGRSILALGADQVAAVAAMNEKIERSEIPFECVDCPCGSSRFAGLACSDRYGLIQSTVICTRCGLVQSNPRMTESAYRRFYESDEYRVIYEGDRFLDACQAHYLDGRGNAVYERVTSYRPATQIRSVLEFGAAGGWNLLPFLAAGIQATGYDYSRDLVTLGRTKGIDLVCGGLEDVAGQYDVIVLNHVVEHFSDVPQALRTLRAHLAPDGFMFVAVPDVEDFALGQLQNAHTYYFTRRTLEFCGALAGLRMTNHRRELSGHMSAIFVPSDEPLPDVSLLEGHYDEIAARLRRFERRHRLLAPVRVAGRILDSIGLKTPVRRLLRIDREMRLARVRQRGL